ncbi:FAD-dependent oxidoreductase [Paracoccus aerodenitrificans]|uniref:FAD-dependent oxidoreductase n=1 Tax=Paracoccus aerodenitrificans TaxID=3017781 RepID=UPI0022F0243F|nr:FAD-dependent oxidoreductase [Paracoccus aerodenitrificans]WBU64625.1 FAD-dependent oxidoreductase [Paracoccus aerodenitrificans]
MTGDITILGAGVAGLAVAHELLRRGVRPEIIDPAGAPGPHCCSWWAGGMLAPHCEGETAEEPVIRLGGLAAGWWRDAGVEVTQSGTLVVALDRDRSETERFSRRTIGHDRIAEAEIAGLEPDLAGRFDTALHFASEAHINPRQALDRLWAGLKKADVSIDCEGQPKGIVIDCRGLAARDCLPNLRGVRGEMVLLRASEISLRRPVRLLHPRHPLYIVPRGDGVFMLGATQIESDGRGPVTLRSAVELLNSAYALHPAFAEAEILEIAADARPAFPDNLPRIVRKDDRIFVNGLFRHGFLLAPALAGMVADLVLDGKLPELML